MEFYRHLKRNKIYKLLEHTEYVSPTIYNYNKFKKFVVDAISNNKKILVYGDYDPDGLSCILAWKKYFYKMDYNNFHIFEYRERTHSIDEVAILEAIEGKYDYIIINDAGSSEMDKINKLINFGVKVILVDHHQTIYSYESYPEDCAIVNSTLENKHRRKKGYSGEDLNVSAGALVFILLDKLLEDYRKYSRDLSAYALFSLYADCIDMSSDINRGIYHMAIGLGHATIPSEIAGFLNEYSSLNRRFVEFNMTPKINCAFRKEMFSPLNNVFLAKEYAQPNLVVDMVQNLAEMHSFSLNVVNKATDIIYYEKVGDFVVGNLNSVSSDIDIESTKLYNYTGLIANKLSERFKRPSVVYCGLNNSVKGSFRDILGRNYLQTFRSFSQSEGHNAAFGIKLHVMEVPDFLRNLKDFGNNKQAQEVKNEPVIIPGFDVPPDKTELMDMAMYNEFAGIRYPIVVIGLSRTGKMTERPNRYGGYIYKWGSHNIHSSKRIPIGCKLLIRPTKTKGLKLYAL